MNMQKMGKVSSYRAEERKSQVNWENGAYWVGWGGGKR